MNSGVWTVGGPNETLQLSVSVLPSNTTNQTVTWSSDNSSAVSVNASGLVTATSAGTGSNGETIYNVTITATANDGSGKTATFVVLTSGLT